MHSSLGHSGQFRCPRHPRDVPGSCSYTTRPQLSSRLLARQRQRTVRVNAAAKSLYEVLGVSESANERDIKRAYRQKALKLHPDVNKAPNAEAQFLEVKNAFTVLSDAQQRADYDRKMRGGFGSWGTSGGGFGDYGSWGSSSSTSTGTTGSRQRPKQQEEEFYGLGDLLNEVGSGVGQWVQQQAEELSKLQQGAADVLGGVVQKAGDSIKSGKLEDFFNDLEKEVSAWSKQRAESGKPASLWEELSAIGEEFVDFLEAGLGEEYKSSTSSSTKGKDGSSSGGSTEFNHQGGSGGAASKPRTPVDKYEELKRRYDLFDESFKKSRGGGGGSSSSNNGTSSSSSNRASAAAGSSRNSGSSSSSQSSTPPPPPPNNRKTRDEEVEDELAALKKKLGKL